ncbi:MAG: hypothetical protein CL572_00880 [Alphaproteobacteria bacterium]|nr:hypothetical protein [Alphaproteobacteria bacterium]
MFTVKKLKISGFKSFAHPIEILVEDGVTGIIGPNGCGKSNIFEAIRWVMGETSSKSLRSGAMDDVIFNGTQNLPPKNFAEVSIELDDFTGDIQSIPTNEKKVIISRTLERGVGSFYKINNKDVRAKDVSILFYDSGSGPRSSSIISQGNIDQIINFKPIERKIILEDAAGTSGLQARRHESELKLQSTEVNLEKLEINLNNLIEQKRSLSRQARQAERYEHLSQTIKFYQSILMLSEWKENIENIKEYNLKIEEYKNILKNLIQETNNQSEKINLNKNKVEILNKKKEEVSKNMFSTENEINKLKHKLEGIQNKTNEINKFLHTILNDKNLEKKKYNELCSYILTIENKKKQKKNLNFFKEKLTQLYIDETNLKNELKQLETIFVNEIQLTLGDEFRSDNLKEEKSNLVVKKGSIEEEINKIKNNIKNIENLSKQNELNLKKLENEKRTIEKNIFSLKNNISKLINDSKKQKEISDTLDDDTETSSNKLTEIITEIKTLNQLTGNSNLSKDTILNLIKINAGYENAVYASLMYELDATIIKSAKMWVKKDIDDLLPINNPLSTFVKGPKELSLVLSQIGFVNNKEEALKKQKDLKIGQSLVDKKGNIWRWDGFISEENLQNKKIIDSQLKINKLEERKRFLEQRLSVQNKKKEKCRLSKEKIDKQNSYENKKLESLYQNLDSLIAKLSSEKEKNSILKYDTEKFNEKINELNKTYKEIKDELKSIKNKEDLLLKSEDSKGKSEKKIVEKKIQDLDKKIEEKRNEIISIKELIVKEELNESYLENDMKKTKLSLEQTKKQVEILEQREKTYLQENEKLKTQPDELNKRIENNLGIFNEFKNEYKKIEEVSNSLLFELNKDEEKIIKLNSKRENNRNEITRIEGLQNSSKEKEKELRNIIFERSKKQPEEIENSESFQNSKLKNPEDINKYLEKITFQREQMGPVNLRAKIEEKEIESSIEEIELEKNDLEQAIEKLRIAINKINSEGKNRLITAFEKVNRNFSDLFKKLFSGGEAKLELVKSDDPLQTGLEIFARPPGKKLSNISLLSGGEKTLTAISLIFSIFLINPSPICILDEVDAALDDINVEKFCKILAELKNNTKTKFLIITHHKTTMASIDRVYGVTMAQKGISDIVSVDFDKDNLKEAV